MSGISLGTSVYRSEAYINYRRANSGGPCSRTRKERIRATLLGTDDSAIRCPRIVRVGIHFPNDDPVGILSEILNEQGYRIPRTARRAAIDHRLIAWPWAESGGAVDPRHDERPISCGTRAGVAQHNDPARLVLWTASSPGASSLIRRVA
jgi:hypothetical protein